MRGKPRWNMIVLAIAAAASLGVEVLGQTTQKSAAVAAASGPGVPGGFGGPGGFGFRRGDFLDDVKQQIQASDEEWKVIGPKLRKVALARQALEADRTEMLVFGGAGPGGFGGPPDGGPGGGAFVSPEDRFVGGRRGGPGGRGGFGPGAPRGGFNPGGPGQPGTAGPDFFDGPPGGPPPIDGAPGFGGRRGGGGGFGGRGGGFGRGGFGGPPGGGPFGGGGALGQTQMELQAVLANPKATSEEIQEKVAAVRAARQKLKAESQAAQKDLLELLTADQEIVLVSLGYVD